LERATIERDLIRGESDTIEGESDTLGYERVLQIEVICLIFFV